MSNVMKSGLFSNLKEKNVPEDKKNQFGFGDIWTWVAIDADTQLVPCWHLGPRNNTAAKNFIDDLAGRLANRIQLTTDGHHPYLESVEHALGDDIDYARLIEIYGEDPSPTSATQRQNSRNLLIFGSRSQKVGTTNASLISVVTSARRFLAAVVRAGCA